MFTKNISLFLFVLSNFLTASPTEICRLKVNLSEILLAVDGIYYKSDKGAFIKMNALDYENGSYIVSAPKGILDDVFGVWYCYTETT